MSFSVATMTILILVAVHIRKKGRIENHHYFLAFLVTLNYGLVMFWYGDNSKGIIMFGLVYPVLSIFILKQFWGNLLIAVEFLASLLIEKYVNPIGMNGETKTLYITIYLMFWAFAITMEEVRTMMEEKILQQKERLAFYADYDGLTKLYNRRKFYDCIREEEPERRKKQRRALIIMDIDDFKKVNDCYGHNIGDEVLEEIARRIRENTRCEDLVCRWGGEEFLVLAETENEESANCLAQKLCNAINCRKVLLSDGKELCITISVGVAFCENFDGSKITLLVSVADEKLYQAKAEGKNRVCLCSY